MRDQSNEKLTIAASCSSISLISLASADRAAKSHSGGKAARWIRFETGFCGCANGGGGVTLLLISRPNIRAALVNALERAGGFE